MPIARAVAAALSCALLVNAGCAISRSSSEWSIWLVDLRDLSSGSRGILLLMAGISALCFAIRCPRSKGPRALIVAGLFPILLAALVDTVRYLSLLQNGVVHDGSLLSFSLCIAALLGFLMVATLRHRESEWRSGFGVFAGTAFALPLLLPLGLMGTFGRSDYRSPADAAVVFGAKVYSDGGISDVLADRVNTACELYEQGLVKTIVFSGGPGDGPIPEADAMRAAAVARGVPPTACVVDYEGVNTRATLEMLQALAEQRRWGRVLAVSNSFHLPRIKLLADRLGLDVRTVPARERYRYSSTPAWLARETLAWWAYLLNART